MADGNRQRSRDRVRRVPLPRETLRLTQVHWRHLLCDGIPVRRWRTAWRTACQSAGVPTRFLHDCRRTAARNLIRANVPERVAMLLTGHKSRAIFDRYNIIHRLLWSKVFPWCPTLFR